ncbi:MAG TPA: hypothetical protein PLB89_16180 [Flavobacteriales bacterium]|nr:hypothetical protein [Flavobacteriales bacterium]
MKQLLRPILPLVLLSACASDPVPKPRGYFRIDLPPQDYVIWTDSATFSTELPSYAKVGIRPTRNDARWFDVRFPKQRATVHLTWSPVGDQLEDLIEDAHRFKSQHQAMAAKIESKRVLRDSARVFGSVFNVEGDVASPLVFYFTDSTDNFLYGALYFDARPNADSLAPVTERIRADMQHMAATLAWK